MYVKKRVSLLLFAALAMVLFTACGRWDFSREAAKAANEAQGANPVVTFDTSRALTDALRDAAGENIQPADIEAALKADGTLTELLAGRSDLDIYFAAGDQSADDAAAAIAAQFGRLTGRKPEAFIAMVKADNGWFYAAVVTTTTGGSGSGSGSGSGTGSDDDNGGNDPGTTPGGGEEPGTDPDEGEDETQTYTVTVKHTGNGSVKCNGTEQETISAKAGDKIVLTLDAEAGNKVESVTVDSKAVEHSGDTFTFTVEDNHTVNVVFAAATIDPDGMELIIPDGQKDKFHTLDQFFYDVSILPPYVTFREGMKIKVNYEESNVEPTYVDITKDLVLSGDIVVLYDGGHDMYQPFTFAKDGNQEVTLHYYDYDETMYVIKVNINVKRRI